MNKENSLRFFFTQHIFVRSQHQLETKQTVNLDTAAQWKYSIIFYLSPSTFPQYHQRKQMVEMIAGT